MVHKLLIENIGWLVTGAGGRQGPVVGEFENALGLKKDVCLAIEDGKILALGEKESLVRQHNLDDFERIDAQGRLVTPGLVDSHTHPVFAGDRKEEFELRNRGVSYQTIARTGGGIFSTVRATRQAPAEKLEQLFLQRLSCFLAEGTTAVDMTRGHSLRCQGGREPRDFRCRCPGKQPVEL